MAEDKGGASQSDINIEVTSLSWEAVVDHDLAPETEKSITDQPEHDWRTCEKCQSYDEQTLKDLGRLMAMDLVEASARIEGCQGAYGEGFGIHNISWIFEDVMGNVTGQGEAHVNTVNLEGMGDETRLRSIRNRHRVQEEHDGHPYLQRWLDEWDYSKEDGGVVITSPKSRFGVAAWSRADRRDSGKDRDLMRPFIDWATSKGYIDGPNQSVTRDIEDRANGWTVRTTVIKHPESGSDSDRTVA